MLSVVLFLVISTGSLNAVAGSGGNVSIQSSLKTAGESRYFPQTGKTVNGDFLRAFDRYGLARIGWPISEEMAEGDLKVQYFERVRMEYHPELATRGTTVLLTRLGALMAPQGQMARIGPFTSNNTRLYIPETGHSLAAPFLSYWRDRGGVELYGYPISEMVWEGGLKVQWFERARMEYHPELVSKGWEVQLTLLGERALATTAANSVPQAPAAAQGTNLTDTERRMLDLINAERAKAGVGAVAPSPELVEVAQGRSSDMATRNYFSHTTPDGADVFAIMQARNIPFSYAGEIISKAINVGIEQGPQSALQAFLDSPGHKAIMLKSQYNYVGVGYARTANNESYFTVVFVQR
jgi:uncharacterized protein YkwD